jgi:hypothetical protein
MYGRKPGQSFHEQKLFSTDYGGKADQITMGVRIRGDQERSR